VEERLARSLRSAEATRAHMAILRQSTQGLRLLGTQLLHVDAMTAALTDIKLLIPGKSSPLHVVGLLHICIESPVSA